MYPKTLWRIFAPKSRGAKLVIGQEDLCYLKCYGKRPHDNLALCTLKPLGTFLLPRPIGLKHGAKPIIGHMGLNDYGALNT